LVALETLAGQSYDVVLMDCHMPNLDGFGATRRIRESEKQGQRQAVVALTASALAEDREKCVAAGMDAYMTKPVRLADLRSGLTQYDHERKASQLLTFSEFETS
ncbi:MAG: response regulator, partial [Planctomycetaceae bacterium]